MLWNLVFSVLFLRLKGVSEGFGIDEGDSMRSVLRNRGGILWVIVVGFR